MKKNQLVVDNILDELPELDATAAIVDHVDNDSLSYAPALDAPTSDEPSAAVRSLLIRVLDVQGNIIYSSPSFSTLTLPPESVAHPLHNRPWNATVINMNGQPVRIYSAMLVSHNHTP